MKDKKKKRFIIAIDGRCASGKTTLAAALAKRYKGTIFHMDDYYLQPYQRTEERYREPGGNVDRERFLEEVLKPLKAGEKEIHYKPFDCTELRIGEGEVLEPETFCIVEGSYSLHPELREYYDYTCFMDIDEKLQFKRLMKRNGLEGVERFMKQWIPLEEEYFNKLSIRECADKLIYVKEKKVNEEE